MGLSFMDARRGGIMTDRTGEKDGKKKALDLALTQIE